MADTNVPPPILPAHIAETIGSITRLHAEHQQNATLLQRAVAQPADPQRVLDAIKEIHAEAAQISGSAYGS